MKATDIICQGYLRDDGTKGIRNKVLIIYTVECSRHVGSSIVRHFEERGFDVECVGNNSCLENAVVVRRLLRFATHPNVGAVLVVGHGCEYTQPNKIVEFTRASGRLAEAFLQQEQGGTVKSIQRGIELVEQMLSALSQTPRAPMELCELMIGVECGGSDFTSGLAGNALLGAFVDGLIDAEGTAVFEEMHEAVGLKEYMVARGVDAKAQKEIATAYDKTIQYCMAFGEFSISPGNFVGGLTTIEEKSMGAVVKTGSRPIQGILKIAQKPPKKGLWGIDVVSDERVEPFFFTGGDATAMMELSAAGAHLVFLVSGRGHVAGIPVSPTIKITGNRRTYINMSDDFDIDASGLLMGEQDIEKMRGGLYEYVQSICQGELTCAERLGQREGILTLNYQHPYQVKNRILHCQ